MTFDKVLTKVFGSSNERFLKSIKPAIAEIAEFEPEIQALTDDQLRERTLKFKDFVAESVKVSANKFCRRRLEERVLNEITPAAFVLVIVARTRTPRMCHLNFPM